MRAVLAARSTRALRNRERSICIPLSQLDLPAALCPPHFTARSRLFSRANVTAFCTSAAPVGWTTRAGYLSYRAFNNQRASSYASPPGNINLPLRLSLSSWTAACASVTSSPSPVNASISDGTLVGVCTNDWASACAPGSDAAIATDSDERIKRRRSIFNPPEKIAVIFLLAFLSGTRSSIRRVTNNDLGRLSQGAPVEMSCFWLLAVTSAKWDRIVATDPRQTTCIT